jgi:integrase
MRNRHVSILGKGSKERLLPFCARTGRAIWRYLATRTEDTAGDYLFLTGNETPFDRHDLRKTLWRIGQRAGVQGVNVHRFRHTFAINYLRNGAILIHSKYYWDIPQWKWSNATSQSSRLIWIRITSSPLPWIIGAYSGV